MIETTTGARGGLSWSSRRFRLGAAAAVLLAAVGVGAMALPSSAQEIVSCIRAVSSDGQIQFETWIGPAPCPDGFSQASDSTTTSEAETTTTTAAQTTTTTAAETTTTAAETTTTAAETTTSAADTTTTSADAGQSGDALGDTPAADPVDSDPDYTG